MHAGVVPPVIANVTGWLQENCGAKMTPRQHYELQDLFSVYVHRMPGFKGADETSLFHNRDIENRCDMHAPHAYPDLITFGCVYWRQMVHSFACRHSVLQYSSTFCSRKGRWNWWGGRTGSY